MKKIPLCGPSGKGKAALVDDQDYDLVRNYKWYINTGGYAATVCHKRGKRRKDKDRSQNLIMHTLLMGKPPKAGLLIDHKNRNKLDNRRENLRWVTYSQNARNNGGKGGKSKYKGVFPDVYVNTRWRATIRQGGRNLWLGAFSAEKEAALVYDKAARHFFGEYAACNFPDEQYSGRVRYVDYMPDTKRSSKYKGVSYYNGKAKRVKRWRAIYKGKTIGYFLTEEEAAEAYRRAAG